MTDYTVRVERVAEYTVEAESEDAAIELVRRCRSESYIRAILIDATTSFQPDDGVVIRITHESHSASRTPRPIVWVETEQ